MLSTIKEQDEQFVSFHNNLENSKSMSQKMSLNNSNHSPTKLGSMYAKAYGKTSVTETLQVI